MNQISEELAEILGLLCSEGSYTISTSRCFCFYKERGKKYLRNKTTRYIQFGNYDKKLLQHFRLLVEKEYGHRTGLEKDRIRICKRFIIDDLLRYTSFGVLKWKLPTDVKNSTFNIKIKFLRGYFDGDGTVSSQIRFFSSNGRSLKDVSNLLHSVGIGNNFKGPYFRKGKRPSFYIYVRRKYWDKFLELINPISKIHKKDL